MGEGSEITADPSWAQARKYAALVCPLPDTLSLCTRSLLRNAIESNRFESTKPLDLVSKFLLMRLLRSRAMQAKLYYAALCLEPEKLALTDVLTPEAWAAFFTSADFSTIFSLLALHRQVKRVCPKEEWEKLSSNFYRASNLGYHLGKAIPAIGTALGMLVGGLRHLIYPIYCKTNLKGFKEYRRFLKSEGKAYDLDKELHYFECTHPQIASILLQNLGFGVSFTHLLQQALSQRDHTQLPGEALPLRVVSVWLDSLTLKNKAPETDVGDEFYMSDEALDRFIESLDQLAGGESATHWMNRGKDDISPADTPKLFQSATTETSAPRTEAPSDEGSIDSELSKQFTEEEIEKINSEAQEVSE